MGAGPFPSVSFDDDAEEVHGVASMVAFYHCHVVDRNFLCLDYQLQRWGFHISTWLFSTPSSYRSTRRCTPLQLVRTALASKRSPVESLPSERMKVLDHES